MFFYRSPPTFVMKLCFTTGPEVAWKTCVHTSRLVGTPLVAKLDEEFMGKSC